MPFYELLLQITLDLNNYANIMKWICINEILWLDYKVLSNLINKNIMKNNKTIQICNFKKFNI